MYNFLCQAVPIFPIYTLLTERIDTFWSRNIDSIWIIGHFEPKIHKDF